MGDDKSVSVDGGHLGCVTRQGRRAGGYYPPTQGQRACPRTQKGPPARNTNNTPATPPACPTHSG